MIRIHACVERLPEIARALVGTTLIPYLGVFVSYPHPSPGVGVYYGVRTRDRAVYECGSSGYVELGVGIFYPIYSGSTMDVVGDIKRVEASAFAPEIAWAQPSLMCLHICRNGALIRVDGGRIIVE